MERRCPGVAAERVSPLEFPVRRYQFTLVAFLCLVALGWFAFANVPREEDPQFKIPGYFITAIYPGADPRDLEQLVAKPIEDKLAELDDVKKIETTITDGVSFIVIEFQAYVDADRKYDEVTREVNALRPTLPADLAQIEIRKLSPGLVNTIQLALEDDRIHSVILGYWHTIITPPMVFAELVVSVVEEMKARGIQKPIVASLAGDAEVEEAAEFLYRHGIPAYPYTTETPVQVLAAKYRWARGAGLT